jgi:hypothetical protein
MENFLVTSKQQNNEELGLPEHINSKGMEEFDFDSGSRDRISSPA